MTARLLLRRPATLFRLACAVSLVIASATLAPAEPAKGADADLARKLIAEIEASSAATRSLSSSFVQTKHLALFDKPLVLTGTLHVRKPDRFAFHVEKPLRYSMTITGETLRQWDEDTDEVQTISLSDNPGFKLVVRQMRGWLSGAYTPMLGDYDVRVLRQAPPELEFVPREGALAHGVVERVRVSFGSDLRIIQEIEILDRDGDRTIFQFSAARINAEIPPSAWDVEPSDR